MKQFSGLSGQRGKKKGSPCRYSVLEGEAVTDGQEIANGFCDLYCQVGPKLAAKILKEQSKKFNDSGP